MNTLARNFCFWRAAVLAVVTSLGLQYLHGECLAEKPKTFRAGAYSMDITPSFGPLLVSGGFLEKSVASMPPASLHSRCLVLDDGTSQIAIVIVDSCMIPRDVCDRAKELAAKATGLRSDRILISATHTHSAPSVMDFCLGTRADPRYTEFLPAQVAEGIKRAHERLAPARVGWATADAHAYTNCRRWILRSDKMGTDPFGQLTVRAMMHPGYQNPAYIGPAGPIDPTLSLLAVQTPDGKPISVLANLSMHYFGGGGPADYFAIFADTLVKKLEQGEAPSPVCMMSQGTSGDLHWMDYRQARRSVSVNDYAESLAEIANEVYQEIEFQDWVPLAMDEQTLTLSRRLPDAARLEWARDMLKNMKGRRPQNRPEVYAEQAVFIHENPTEQIKLQALRIGELGITAIPNEVYGITGLKLKLQSPLKPTFNIELANGASGYIPPPSQHRLGGYTTWPARTAGLEEIAEPKIVEALLSSLEKITGRQRRPLPTEGGSYIQSLLDAKPLALWRMDEIQGDTAADASGNGNNAEFREGVAFFLDGPHKETFSQPHVNRAVHFAGGYLKGSIDKLPAEYSVSLWFWNGLPASARAVTGTLFTRGENEARETLLLGGNRDPETAGKLIFRSGDRTLAGRTPLQTKRWHQVTLVRAKDKVSVYLDGNPEAEIETPFGPCVASSEVFVAGDSQATERFEGKIDEVAIFDRIVSADEVVRHYRASEMLPPPRPKPVRIIKAKPADSTSLERLGKAVLASKPLAYWRLHDKDATVANDTSPNELHGTYEQGAAPYSPGGEVSNSEDSNFNGGRMRAVLESLGDTYSVELWVWNETPHHARPVTGYMFSRGVDGSKIAAGDNLGIGGTHAASGRLIVFNGNERNQLLEGSTQLVPRSWNHVVMVRQDNEVAVYLNGDTEPDIQAQLPITYEKANGQVFIGGRNDNFANFVGRIDEVAVYERALTPKEVKAHFDASGVKQVEESANDQPAQPVTPKQPAEPEPTDVGEAIKSIHVREGFQVQLVAAEPLVIDPVAIDWGTDGKLWVVEMADYPLGIDGKGKAGGRVRYLEDTNDDGQYDKSTLFADGLSFPNGVLAWGRGILVTAAPEIVYLEDTNDDGKADVRRVLYSGFLEGNQQLRVNGLRWGLDNWVYCASGSHHAGYGKESRIVSQLTGNKYQIGSRDFRIRPDTGEIDAQSGPSQYGRNRDDWGSWFGVQNSHPLWHYVLDDQNIRRNPHFAPPDPKRQVVTPANPLVYPASKLQKRFHSFNQSGRFTSACSAMIYRDDLLFDRGTEQKAVQHAFTCEPFHNLVQHNLIVDDGVSFGFRRDPAEAKSDFFASEDRWCRPAMVRTGPDGALWIVDMYRYMIEHPQWLPQNGKDELRPWFRSGDEHGRIYRVVRSDQPAREVPRLAELSPKQLVAVLESPNGWQRDAAQRLLVRGNQEEAIAPLRELAGNSEQPLARLHALWTLDGLDALQTSTLEAALADNHAGVRRNAVQIASRVVVDAKKLARLADDPDAKVRLELASTLGEYDDPSSSAALAKLAIDSNNDPYITAAVMSSLTPQNVSAVLASVFQSADHGTEPMTLELIGQVVAMDEKEAVGKLIELVCSPQREFPEIGKFEALARILDGLANRDWSADKLPGSAGDRIAETIQHARAVAANHTASEDVRAKSIQMLGREDTRLQDDFKLMQRLLVPQSPLVVQRAVVAHLAGRSEPSVAEVLLSGWQSHSPEFRSQIVDVLASRQAWSESLRQRLEAGTILVSELSAPVQQRLLARSDNSPKWQQALAAKASADRVDVLRQFESALELDGDATRGAVVFRKLCINCHKIKDEGHEVGPQLASITNKTKESLLTSILDPSAAVEAKYFSYVIVTGRGRSHSGMLETETGSSITLLAAEGKRETILRRDIDELHASTKSLMPEGLEQGLKPQDLADLIQFVQDSFR